MVQEPARGGNQHVNATVDQLVLFAKRHAADQQSLGQLGIFGIGVEILGDLCRQFAGWCQHEAARHPGAGATFAQKGNHRQHETGSFAGAGLGNPQDIAPFKCGGNRPGLDRGWRGIARVGDCPQDRRVQFQIGKLGHQRPYLCGIGPQGDGTHAPRVPRREPRICGAGVPLAHRRRGVKERWWLSGTRSA